MIVAVSGVALLITALGIFSGAFVAIVIYLAWVFVRDEIEHLIKG